MAILSTPSVLFIGTDDHQCYISARALGITNDAVLYQFRPVIHSGLECFLINADLLLMPRNDRDYCTYIQDFFSTLVQKKVIELRRAQSVFRPTTAEGPVSVRMVERYYVPPQVIKQRLKPSSPTVQCIRA